jgi:hypothetical protein
MDHVAIMDRKLRLLPKILSGEKTIESRWYKFKKTPYRNVNVGDVVYFKNAGDLVSVKTKVSKVLFFDDLNDEKIINILEKYGKKIRINLSYANELVGKRYCSLIFLKDFEEIAPFEIDKKGFGMMAAWISVNDIDKIKRKA